ncbi:MAG: phenylacetate--CoA ligase [Candidatus Baltobacteraceae bacterium]
MEHRPRAGERTFADVETYERPALEALQLARLQALWPRLAAIPYYLERLALAATPQTLGELGALPFTTKRDLRDAYPLGMLAVPANELARVHASSGTTGNPTLGAYTANDLAMWADVCARSLQMAGLRRGEFFQITWGYGLFTGGLGMHGGVERLGACAIPASSGNTARQMQLLETLPVVGIGSTPSYALLLAERFAAEGRTPKALRIAVCGAETWTVQMRAELELRLGVIATNIYGLTEIVGPGVAQECAFAKGGLHVHEDHFLPEIVDPQSSAVLPDGERGELVLTTLTREAMPVLRYRTGDLTRITRERCRCGRTLARIDWIAGRTDDMLTIRGVNVFPSAIEEVLLGFEDLTSNYRIVVDRSSNGLDALTIEIERALGRRVDEEALSARVRARLADVLLVTAACSILEAGTLERVEAGKVKRVTDRR